MAVSSQAPSVDIPNLPITDFVLAQATKRGDKPALIENQQVVGRLEGQIPGPITQSVPKRDWFPI